MRIAEEIGHVMKEFVSFEDLFNALTAEQELKPYQTASWMLRNLAELERLPMIECNRDLRDFRLLDKGWVPEALYDLAAGDSVDWGSSDTGPGFVGGWLESDLRGFFKQTSVDFPESAISDRGASPPSLEFKGTPSPPPSDQVIDVEDVDGKPVGTKERTTLLTIIAALAGETDIQIVSPSKSAEVIASLTERMGAPVAKRTIEEHLKRVPDALERRTR